MRNRIFCSLVAVALLAPACEKASAPAPTAQPAPAGLPAGGGGPSPTAPRPGDISGTVLETMDSGGYTYLRLKTSQGEAWAAVAQTKVAVGDKVVITGAALMTNFNSPTLNRTFEQIYFGSLGAPGAGGGNPHGGGVPGGAHGDPGGDDLATAHAGAGGGAKATLDAPVAKAEGETGRTVAEVYAQKGTLSGKPVAVRGKVVKFNAGIMGKNWVHLQDGSGTPAAGDFDLTVTTDGTAGVGDVVLIRGVVGTDRDFGAGYAYPVIVEEATIEK